MTEFFDLVYQDQKCMAHPDTERGFYTFNVESLDAPAFIPAGATSARDNFHFTSFTYRGA